MKLTQQQIVTLNNRNSKMHISQFQAVIEEITGIKLKLTTNQLQLMNNNKTVKSQY